MFQKKFIHWFLIKCKQMIKSVSISKFHVMIHEFDIELVIKSTIKNFFKILVFLYNHLPWFEIIVRFFNKIENNLKKRWIIKIMCFQQFYKQRKILEMKWIKKTKNFINAIIKIQLCVTLQQLIDINKINIKTLTENKINK